MKPILKWTGGKRKLVPLLRKHLPEKYGTYHEPFIGGAALLLAVQPTRACVSDLNADLINVYREVRYEPYRVIDLLKTYPNTEEFYYKLRDAKPETSLEKAARFLYLNRACFNGLYRVNKSGKFNVPYGKYKTLQFDFDNMVAVSSYLKHHEVSLMVRDYKQALKNTLPGDFVYLDPPYHGTFTGYTAEQFGKEKLEELAEHVHMAVDRGVKILVSNSNHEEVREAFKKYTIIPVDIAWTIGQKGDSRARKENEVLIKTY